MIERPSAVDGGDGWERFGPLCSAGRRSMWVRYTYDGDSRMRDETAVSKIEICGGREGDDLSAVFTRDNPQFADILEIVNMGVWINETVEDEKASR